MHFKSKKLFSLLFVVFTLALLLVACGPKETNQAEQPPQPNESETISDGKSDDAFPRTVKDGRGIEVTLNAKPERIVSTALAIDEFLLSLVDPEQIIAVTEISTDEGISNVANLTTSFENKIQKLNAEQTIALKPDLVILATYSDPEVVKQLEDTGLTLYQLEDQASIFGLLNSVKQLGDLLDEEQNAEKIVNDVEFRLQKIKEKVATIPENERLSVLYWTDYGSTVTANTSISEMIATAGGINVIEKAQIIGEEDPNYPKLSKEKAVELNPDVIITGAWVHDPSQADFVDRWKEDKSLQGITAFKEDRVYQVNSAHLTTASHYFIDGIEDIFALLYPELAKE